ncbi:DUF3331 domain-containing protein [Roseateles sp. SL47]|jgi:Domain of unknown function (DUF3331)|uniref:DUF3331 domain-containing protein n=1 Tax=Roseateles sp. SL47 TaxID=2995138 RepID=UPI00226E08E4|nr:DUF3331 domain-containing protein [Roseateles sp. SL47]WAC73362.1 DUF3331 domain-containing protein [Roseateles sp. SL47]
MHSEHKEMAQEGWLRTIAWLGARGADDHRASSWRPPSRAPVRRAVHDAAPVRPPATIHVLDRPTPRTAAISWSDPGVCHYGYQIWDMAPAKRTGVCVLTGSKIQIGDIVYCPREEEAPVNAGAMIAAAYVDA